jgi:hypothetical protein
VGGRKWRFWVCVVLLTNISHQTERHFANKEVVAIESLLVPSQVEEDAKVVVVVYTLLLRVPVCMVFVFLFFCFLGGNHLWQEFLG